MRRATCRVRSHAGGEIPDLEVHGDPEGGPLLVLGFGFTGYLLPWDQKAYFGTQVAGGIAGNGPGLGLLPLVRYAPSPQGLAEIRQRGHASFDGVLDVGFPGDARVAVPIDAGLGSVYVRVSGGGEALQVASRFALLARAATSCA